MVGAMSVGQKLRFEVFKRDSFTCQYCGRKPPDVVLNADHVLAKAAGGGDDFENLVTSCWDCNIGKFDRPVDVTALPQRESLEIKAERLAQMKALHEMLLGEEKVKSKLVSDLCIVWAKRDGLYHSDGKFNYWSDLPDALRQFLKKLPLDEIHDAIAIAFRKFSRKGVAEKTYQEYRFKFFCGTCWRKIKQREEEAECT